MSEIIHIGIWGLNETLCGLSTKEVTVEKSTKEVTVEKSTKEATVEKTIRVAYYKDQVTCKKCLEIQENIIHMRKNDKSGR